MKRLALTLVLTLSLTALSAQDYVLSPQDTPAADSVYNPRRHWSTVVDYMRDSVYYKKTRTGKAVKLNMDRTSASISLAGKTAIQKELDAVYSQSPKNDEFVIQDDKGNEMIVMKAIKDEETGDMVANEMLQAAVVVARFRNVAERNGKVDLEFDIRVPRELYDKHWQLRFQPRMIKMGEETDLEPVIITGSEYRKRQLYGYEQYNKFLKKIVTDPTRFIDVKNLERFLSRNIPQIYVFKNDSTEVSDEMFYSAFGVSEQQAIDHYTSKAKIRANRRRIAARDAMYRKYVKTPIDSVGVRLDTVFQDMNGDFVYGYVHTIRTEKNLKKVDIALSGSIYEQDKKIYSIPQSEPLSFYISSLATFVDSTPRYLLRIVERQAEANQEYNIEFASGKYDVRYDLGDNATEIARIKKSISALVQNEVFDLDSIVITSFASPEGSVNANRNLAQKRSEAVGEFFSRYSRHVQDSLKEAVGILMNIDGEVLEMTTGEVKFVSRNGGENWYMLDQYVEQDTTLTESFKEQYFKLASVKNLDSREAQLKPLPGYSYMKSELYPKTRTVSFKFNLHRRGMVKDTVHTTVLDTTYMRGVEALRERDYDTAVAILRPYQDYNTAVAFTAMDYNVSAMNILERLEKTPQVNYMMALIYSRQGNDQKAVQCYMNSVAQDRSYVNRGNLDPEIKVLIDRYNLNKEDDYLYDF